MPAPRKQEHAQTRPPGRTTVSAILPMLNEADYIEQTLQSVQAQDGPTEVIAVDGGSTDDTPARAASTGARVIAAPKGRARQMNAGAARASGEVLLFLHADTTLPEGALGAVRQTLANPAAEAGTFRLRFDRQGTLFSLYAFATRLRWRRLCYGDRGLFVRRSVFEALGGYPDWPIFEDLELADRLHRQQGDFCYLSETVTTAARRFTRVGPLRQQLRNAKLWTRYLCSTDPATTAQQVAPRYRYD